MTESYLQLADAAEAQALFGPRDTYLRKIRSQSSAKVVLKGNTLVIKGTDEQVESCEQMLRQMCLLLRTTGELNDDDVDRIVNDKDTDQESEAIVPVAELPITEEAPRNRDIRAARMGKDKLAGIEPRTGGQRRYVKAMLEHSLVFADGPAGCGKTYLAVAMALQALRREEVRKIVLVRPAVEAGEKLGFLPGDLFAKVNPFVRPLLDAMHDMLDFDQVRRLMANDVIEIAPLAFMRGRTLNETFMILDEGQNTTVTQMKMFLTRMGTDSRIVVTGDATQNDLPKDTRSGLEDGIQRLSGIEGVAIVKLSGHDIVRHRLVREIVSAYETDDNRADL